MALTQISIIGSGNMGRALGICLSRSNYPVFFAGRNPSAAPKRAAELASACAAAGAQPQFGIFTDAVKFGDMFVWTMRVPEVRTVLGDEAVEALKRKTQEDGKCVPVVDLNNLDMSVVRRDGKGAGLDRKSLGELLMEDFEKEEIGNVLVVKAFTTMPMEVFAFDKAELQKHGVQVFVASGPAEGKKAEARKTCLDVLSTMGFEVVDLGQDAQSMRMTEMMGDVMRFCLGQGAGDGGWSHLSVKPLPRVSLASIGERAPGYT